jgi:large subunit ribosomal protein L18
MNRDTKRKEKRAARHARIRRRVSGTAERPRMAIMISNRNMYVQFIDDLKEVTLASASTVGKDAGNPTVTSALALGKTAGALALAAGIRRVVVDRGGFKFHGRVKALVDGAVAGGLQIRNQPLVEETPDAGSDKEAS